MKARLDLAVSPPGIVRGAACHTLVLDGKSLYVIKVSRGWRVGYAPGGALASGVANKTLAHLRKKAEKASTDVTAENYQAMAAGKGCAVVPLSAVSDLDFNDDRLRLRFVGNGKKHKYDFESSEADTARSFYQSLSESLSA